MDYWINQMVTDGELLKSFNEELDKRIGSSVAILKSSENPVHIARQQGMIRACEDLKNTLTTEKKEHDNT